MDDRSLRGKLLVAMPALTDGVFDRTVVYVLEHNEEGAFGLVLNRPTDQGPIEGLVGWAELLCEPSVVFTGGPVQPDALVGLAEIDEPNDTDDQRWALIDDGLGTVDLSRDPALVQAHLGRLRIYHGYSGWGPGQLDGEVLADAWLVAEASRDDLYRADTGDLWRLVLARQPGRTAWLANFPDDLSAN